jgi:hypothetical protein
MLLAIDIGNTNTVLGLYRLAIPGDAAPAWVKPDPLLAVAATIIEGDDALGRPSQVETDVRGKAHSDATRPWPPLGAACSMIRLAS